MSPMSDAFDRFTESNKELIKQVKALDEHITIAEDVNTRSRKFSKIAVVFSVLAMISSLLAAWSLYTNCENANDSRAAASSIWLVVLSASDKNPNQTPLQRAQAKLFREYVVTVYSPHNCWNPLKKYEVPPAPDLGSAQ